MEMYRYIAGTVPVIVSIPHTGTYVPPQILERFTAEAKQLPDTDWHVEKLYDFARELGVHIIAATHSRYVIDLNRAPDNASLYPGKFTTGLCPVTMFNGAHIYQPGKEPDKNEIVERTSIYWQPYHNKLASLIGELKQQFGCVTLFDAHSIRSQVSTLFDGTLPDLNFGTADGATMNAARVEKLLACVARTPYSHILNGRFKGGHITRHYGKPIEGVDSIQLELAQKNYMDEDSFAYDENKAETLQICLRSLLQLLVKDAAR
jgi:N-formylglutamate deformylase